MRKTHYTARGEQIDMSSMALRHANTMALGNAKMNARGDMLGENGLVLRTQEQIEDEWRREKERRQNSLGQQTTADIKTPLTPEQAVAMMKSKKLTDDQDFDPGSPQTTGDMINPMVDKQSAQGGPARRRRIVESD